MALDRRTFLARAGLTAAATGLVSGCSTPACAFAATEGALDWAAVRGLFNLAPDWIHLASFFLVSHPKPVREAIDEYRRRLDANPMWLEEVMFEDGHEHIQDRAEGQDRALPRGPARGDRPRAEHDDRARAALQRPADPAGPGDPDDRARPLLAPRVDPAGGGQERRERPAHRAPRRGRGVRART